MQTNSQDSKYDLSIALNVPNLFTGARLVMLGFVVWFFLQSELFIAGIVLLVAACTDFFDGYFSRKLNQSTTFGSLFDITTDQLLYSVSLIFMLAAGLFSKVDGLVFFNPYLFAVPVLIANTLVFIGVTLFLLKSRTQDMEFPTPNKIAKLASWFWVAPMILILLSIGPEWLVAGIMYLSAIITLITIYTYLKKASYVFTD